jgi:hypothetical protein
MTAFPRARLSPERVRAYEERLRGLLDDLLNEPVDPHGEVYSMFIAFYLAPPYLQNPETPHVSSPDTEEV